MDRAYLLAHASERFLALQNRLSQFDPHEFVMLDEFLIEFAWDTPKLMVKILEAEHDHTDSYHLEARMKELAHAKGIELCFVDEADSLENNLHLILEKLKKANNNKN